MKENRIRFVWFLGAVLSCGFAAQAETLARTGMATLQSGWKATGSATSIGEDRIYWTGTYWGVSFNDKGKGFMHRMAWNCPSITDIHKGMMKTKGMCTLTDEGGDKIYADWVGSGSVGAEYTGHVDMTGGTGKYSGIQGEWGFQCGAVGPDNQLHCTQQVQYKLP